MMNSVELFAGAGGMALGVSQAGFTHQLVTDWNVNACNTLLENKELGIKSVKNWPIIHDDIKNLQLSQLVSGKVDLLSGGPPCQPFSIGGKHKGFNDNRDMFPEAVRAVRELKPRAFIFENVKGLLRPSFAKYFEYIILQLTYPRISKQPEEGWSQHLSRLERQHTQGKYRGLSYRVVFRNVNSADYGIPQRRERVFMVGFRSDQNE